MQQAPCVPTNARSDIWPKLVGKDRPPQHRGFEEARVRALLADGLPWHPATAPVPVAVS